MRNPYISYLSALAAAFSCLAGCGGGDSTDYAADGEKALAAGNYVAAADHLAVAVKEDPGNIDAFVQLAEARLARGEKEAADAAVKSALRIQPDGPGPLLMDAKVAYAMGDWKRAIDSCEKVLARSSEAGPAERASALNCIAAAIDAGGTRTKDEAFASLLHAMYLDPQNPAAVYHMADRIADVFPYEAKDLFKTYVRLPSADGRHVKLVKDVKLPRVLAKIKAIEAKRPSKVDAAKSAACLKSALILRRQKKTQDAKKKFKEAIALDPSNDDAIFAYTDMISSNPNTFKYDNPVEMYKTAVVEWSPSPGMRRKLCIKAFECAKRRGHEVMATQFLERILVSDPADHEVLRKMVDLQERRSNGRFQLAARRYSRLAADVDKSRRAR